MNLDSHFIDIFPDVAQRDPDVDCRSLAGFIFVKLTTILQEHYKNEASE